MCEANKDRTDCELCADMPRPVYYLSRSLRINPQMPFVAYKDGEPDEADCN